MAIVHKSHHLVALSDVPGGFPPTTRVIGLGNRLFTSKENSMLQRNTDAKDSRGTNNLHSCNRGCIVLQRALGSLLYLNAYSNSVLLLLVGFI